VARRKPGPKTRLLKRIERYARTAAALRLRGEIMRAMQYEHEVTMLVNQAWSKGLETKAWMREIKGQRAGARLYKKIAKRPR
jgi:hypothetical protein